MSSMKLIRGYPEYLLESLEAVEKTREKRLKDALAGIEYTRMPLEESEAVLKKHHPDFRETAKRSVRIGPNTGELMVTEVADLLESHSLISPSDIELSSIDFDPDLLIIGAGGAGLTAAIWANKNGLAAKDMLIATKLRLGDSNSKMSQGGIQAADQPNDSPPIHYLDTIGGGHFTNKPELVSALVHDAPSIIKWHEELGVQYDRKPDGTMITISGGGASRLRMHAAKDYTGLEIMRNLMDEVINLEIPVLEFTSAIELIKDDRGHVAGAVLYNMETQEYYVARAKATIMTTGGFGRLHLQGFQTTNHYGATADGLVMAYRAGAKLIHMDSVQYHPTGAAYPEQIVGFLITEKTRSLGGQPLNKYGELFVHPLEPRDIEASALIRECYERNNGIETPTGMRGVWLDSPIIDLIRGEGTIQNNLPAMVRQYARFGIDMTKDPILVFPTLHFQNGGIELINPKAETNLPGLFGAGEVTGGVHGKNRLMGNSIIEYSVYGRRAGIYAAEYAKKAKVGELTLDHITKYEKMLKDEKIVTERKAPLLLPEYRGEKVLSHSLDLCYHDVLR